MPPAKDPPAPGHGLAAYRVHDDINIADLLVDGRPGVVDDLAGAQAGDEPGVARACRGSHPRT
jgi:hypothetical protein